VRPDTINQLAAHEHQQALAVDARRARAARVARRRHEQDEREPWTRTITIRPARATDAALLLGLAALDDATPLRGSVVVAEQDRRVLAARSLEDGAVVADPFAPTEHLRALLSAHAKLLGRRPGSRRPPRFGRRAASLL
jgi:hypothetical protein